MTLQPWARSCPGPGGREPRLLELLKLLELVLLEEVDGLAMWEAGDWRLGESAWRNRS